jgi:hypothetical protein
MSRIRMSRICLRALGVLLVIALAACSSNRLIKANTGIEVLNLQLDTSLDWARVTRPRQQLWTIDGMPLNRFVVMADIKPNEHVFLSSRERRRRPDGPWYRPGMRPDEIRDVLLDAMRELGWSNVQSSNLRPANFGGVAGLRFDAVMTESNGLIYKGTFGAAEHNGKLTQFFWMAPAEHYYDRDVAAVNTMFDSIRFVK